MNCSSHLMCDSSPCRNRVTLGWYALTLLCVLCAGPVLGQDKQATALADAIELKRFEQAFQLLRQAAPVNTAQASGMTALHWAVYHDQTELVRQLLNRDADATAASRYQVQPLSLACQNGNAQICDLLLQSGADPNTSLPGGETALMTAARTGSLEAVRMLVKRGAEVEATERKGQTALMWAAAAGNAQVVRFLLEQGAQADRSLPSGFNALFFAVRAGNREVVQTLLDAGQDVNQAARPAQPNGKGLRNGTSPLLLATENGHFELAAELLKAGANPNDQRTGFTALHALTWTRKPLRGDGDPPPMGSGRMTSLQLARQLLESGAEVDARHGKHRPNKGHLNKTEATPFLLAAETGDIAYLKLLLEMGADPTLTNVDQCTPLLAASGIGVISDGDETAGTEQEAIETIRWLLTLGAELNAVDRHGGTALHGAAYKSWTQLIAFLHEQGADPQVWDRKNAFGWTPLMIAQGHRPGNFRPSAETIQALRRILPGESGN